MFKNKYLGKNSGRFSYFFNKLFPEWLTGDLLTRNTPTKMSVPAIILIRDISSFCQSKEIAVAITG
jgi:hypothetical protein